MESNGPRLRLYGTSLYLKYNHIFRHQKLQYGCLFDKGGSLYFLTWETGGSRAAATSKMDCVVIIVNGFQPLNIIPKHSILDVAAALNLPLLREVLIYIFLPKEGANFRRVCIIEALWYTDSDTILYSDILLITLLDTIVISSDDEMDEYKGDGNISDENNLRLKEFIFCWNLILHFTGLTDSEQWLLYNCIFRTVVVLVSIFPFPGNCNRCASLLLHVLNW